MMDHGMMREMMGRGMMSGQGAGEAQQQPPVSATAVSIKDFAFSPANIRVAKGATVTWTNEDAVPHTATSVSGSELVSPLLGKGATFSHTFTAPGAYAYRCVPHPWMTGIVTVE